MDRFLERFWDGVGDLVNPATVMTATPTEMQGLAGLLRGTFRDEVQGMVTVRLTCEPWNTDERWQVMVQGRRLGPEYFWDWLADQDLFRVPFVHPEFVCRCSRCGDVPCQHAALLTYHWLERASEVPELIFLLLNRRGRARPQNVVVQPINRVPLALGTNLDRTRRDLTAVLEAAFAAASRARDDVFGPEVDEERRG